MADFNQPTEGTEYTQVLDQLRQNIKTVAKLIGNDLVSNPEVGTVKFLNGAFSVWDGTAFVPVPISVTGGGTGSNSADGARTKLDVYSKSATDLAINTSANNLTSTINAITKTQIGLGNLPNAKSDSVSLNDSNTLATSKAVNDKLSALPNSKSDSTTLNSSSTLATSKAVYEAWDRVKHGSVTSGGLADTGFPSGWSVARISTGIYRIAPNYTMSAGDVLMPSPIFVQRGAFSITSSTSGYFTVTTYNLDTGSNADSSFEFIAMRNN